MLTVVDHPLIKTKLSIMRDETTKAKGPDIPFFVNKKSPSILFTLTPVGYFIFFIFKF